MPAPGGFVRPPQRSWLCPLHGAPPGQWKPPAALALLPLCLLCCPGHISSPGLSADGSTHFCASFDPLDVNKNERLEASHLLSKTDKIKTSLYPICWVPCILNVLAPHPSYSLDLQ